MAFCMAICELIVVVLERLGQSGELFNAESSKGFVFLCGVGHGDCCCEV